MTATIRPASVEDADFIAATVLSAQRGYRPRGWFDIALDWPEPRCFDFVRRLAAARTVSWWHASQFLIAEVEGRPAAALCALRVAGNFAAAEASIKEVAREVGIQATEMSEIWRRVYYTDSCWVQGDDSDWLVEHVACLPSHRGRGLVQALIAHALAAGKTAGYSRASHIPDRQ